MIQQLYHITASITGEYHYVFEALQLLILFHDIYIACTLPCPRITHAVPIVPVCIQLHQERPLQATDNSE